MSGDDFISKVNEEKEAWNCGIENSMVFRAN
jgi:hypothetical protein